MLNKWQILFCKIEDEKELLNENASGKRRQNIHIRYDGVGFIPLNEVMQKETA